ncbi:hypothetical protein Tco_1459252 [Tanacetum coccineum]
MLDLKLFAYDYGHRNLWEGLKFLDCYLVSQDWVIQQKFVGLVVVDDYGLENEVKWEKGTRDWFLGSVGREKWFEDEAGVILTDEQNDFLFPDASRIEEIKELSANICLMARIHPANNTFDARPSYGSAFICEVQSSLVTDIALKDNKRSKTDKIEHGNGKSTKNQSQRSKHS